MAFYFRRIPEACGAAGVAASGTAADQRILSLFFVAV